MTTTLCVCGRYPETREVCFMAPVDLDRFDHQPGSVIWGPPIGKRDFEVRPHEACVDAWLRENEWSGI